MKKTMWKISGYAVRTITYLSIISLLVFSCAVELGIVGAIICGCCLAWLGLMALLYWLEKKYNI